ncbi:hypothetical protein TWF506_005596 [Arthrobotrys conoides]|uniref:DUF7587 domain-containing protein n=1 Tax=Arthrobotrys conoides TaxID=74498 RepID=A0AAN8RWY3_9PEZI
MPNVRNPKLNPKVYPPRLYRVHFPDVSHTLYSDAGGFECCAGGRIDICSYNQLAKEFETHFDWYSDEPSHFISMFGTENHALNWARKQLRRGKAQIAMMMEIDPDEIKNAFGRYIPILRVSEVIENNPSLLPDGIEKDWVRDEYLALYKIPGEAIMKTYRIY